MCESTVVMGGMANVFVVVHAQIAFSPFYILDIVQYQTPLTFLFALVKFLFAWSFLFQ